MAVDSTISFPKIFNRITKRGTVSTGIDSINECLRCLLLTSKGELIGDPDYGTDIVKCVYDHNDSIMNDILKNDIVNAVSKYMSNIIIVNYEYITITNSENNVDINIKYYINKTDSIGVYKLVMLEGVE